jgi:hypothetical protein
MQWIITAMPPVTTFSIAKLKRNELKGRLTLSYLLKKAFIVE